MLFQDRFGNGLVNGGTELHQEGGGRAALVIQICQLGQQQWRGVEPLPSVAGLLRPSVSCYGPRPLSYIFYLNSLSFLPPLLVSKTRLFVSRQPCHAATSDGAKTGRMRLVGLFALGLFLSFKMRLAGWVDKGRESSPTICSVRLIRSNGLIIGHMTGQRMNEDETSSAHYPRQTRLQLAHRKGTKAFSHTAPYSSNVFNSYHSL